MFQTKNRSWLSCRQHAFSPRKVMPKLWKRWITSRYYFILLSFFHTTVSWWFFTGIWVTASLLKSPRLFSVFWPTEKNAVVWIISTRPISNFSNPLMIVLSVSITIGINVTFMFYSFFSSLARSRYLYLFSLSFSFTLWSAGTAKSTIWYNLFCCWLSLGLGVCRD